MAKESALLPKMEVVIIIVFFIGFAMWTLEKCGDTKRNYTENVTSNTDAVDEIINRNIGGLELSEPDSSLEAIAIPSPSTLSPSATPSNATTLYITIDGMNLRDEPRLSGKVLTRLKLYEEVTFLGEVTDSTQKINLGRITPDEPWVKVNGRGHIGWVYGAGVHYYKMKLEGVD